MNAPSYRPTHITPPSSRTRALDGGTFIADAALDALVRAGDVMRDGALLTTRDGRRFVARDAARILGRRNGETDPYGLTGRVETIRDYAAKGALISTDSLRLGPAIYDIEWGVLVTRMPSPDESGAVPRFPPA